MAIFNLSMLVEYKRKEREEHWRKYWAELGIYKFEEHSGKPIYSVDTPPPYVTAAHLHTGHILSYSQAEFIVRYKRMCGFNTLYPMGFDDNGYPTERYVEKKYNVNKSKVERKDFIDLCLKETKIGIENYKELWNSLGISVDWSKTYSTIDPLCQKMSQWSFIDLYKKGKVYRKNEPTLWCTQCQTALAQADLEDKELESHLNYIDFTVGDERYTVATTRPELLPGCVGLFAHPDDERFIHLKDKTARVPLFDYDIPVLFDRSIIPTFGTGLMMVCTWGDMEDVKKIKELNLPARLVITEYGKMNSLAGKYHGMTVGAARESILLDLKDGGYLSKQDAVKHVTNVHERCETPVEFIPTTQWFIDVLNIKEPLLEKGRELRWYPEFMEKRYEDWVTGTKWDWCISRQRYYGVPFPVWFCKTCNEIIVADEKDLPIDPMGKVPPVTQCPRCSSSEFIPDTDVMDTWATSSCSPFIIPELLSDPEIKKLIFPNSLRPQAFEIIRTWIFYSMVKAYYHFGSIPFHDVMISGHGLDEKGRKISKRLGNYIEPGKLLEEYGADAIRYWATGATLGTNHKFDPQDVKKGKHTVNKLWNAAKFCASSIGTYSPEGQSTPTLEPEDAWILHQLNAAIRDTTDAFERYEYADVRGILDTFFWGTFCDYYLEVIKHRSGETAVQYTLFHCLLNILKMYAPLLPFITEEIYQDVYRDCAKVNSIHLTSWPSVNIDWEQSQESLGETDLFLKEIDMIRKYKAELKLKQKDRLTDYALQTKVLLDIFGEKLKRMFNIEKVQ